jgi:acyl carrier protein
MSRELPDAELLITVRRYLADDLRRNVTAIADDGSLLEAGAIDSVGVLELVALLEQRHGITISDEELVPEHFETIRAIATFVAEKRDVDGR